MPTKYIRSVLGIFGESPFKPVHTHAEKGGEAVRKLKEAVDAYCNKEYITVSTLDTEISGIEYEADIIKQTIRKLIPSSMMLPVDPNDLLSFLKPQDSIADNAHHTAHWLTLRETVLPLEIQQGLLELMERIVKTVDAYEDMVDDIAKLLETSFSKKEIKQILKKVPIVEELEHEVDITKKQLQQKVFKYEDELGGTGVFYMISLLRDMGNIADSASKAADRLRTMILRR
ncbi:MAG: TIGR00153 family protein [ANME-2 cluster archaeon]|nr:TIGR00153 family protein [ANME-2 cluster archaeon]MDF1558341.1 TIGR00153 family protein [ANME-2 cluster archaeon]